MTMLIPAEICTEEELEATFAQPYPQTLELMRKLEGDIMILGVGGKMGPSLARLAVNACKQAGVTKRVIGVSRFSNPAQRQALEKHGIETIACDLMDLEAVKKLPQVENIIFMAGRKFGSAGSEALTWMQNVIVPNNVASTFRTSRFVVFSTGCIYALLPSTSTGSVETDAPAPVGEYASSCMGRERVFEYYSQQYGTRAVMYRLNYSIDLRYGVLADIARPIWEGRPVSRSVAKVNVIWQGDAVNRALLCLEHASSPVAYLNITGPETLSVAEIAEEFARRFDKPLRWSGEDAGVGYLSNAAKSVELFGKPQVSPAQMIELVAQWIKRGGGSLDKPTHFAVTDGQYLH